MLYRRQDRLRVVVFKKRIMPHILDKIIQILKVESQAFSANEIFEALISNNITRPNDSQNYITQDQIRRAIRADKGNHIEIVKTAPLTYQLKKKIADLQIKENGKSSTSAEESFFKNWLKENHRQITRPQKYVAAIKTISNDLQSRTDLDHLYHIYEVNTVKKVRSFYFNISEFKAKDSRGNRMYSRAFDLYVEYLSNIPDYTSQDILEIINSEEKERQKETLILARIGQGKYRNDLIKLWNGCAISGYSEISLLVASHIKPWSKCDNLEKVDPHNGLLLLPNYDKLFDRGLISFNENGSILISQHFIDSKIFGVNDTLKIELFENNKKYMKYHREHVFKSGKYKDGSKI